MKVEVVVLNNPGGCGRKATDVVWLEDEDVHCCKLFLCCMLRRWLESLYLISLGCVTTILYQQHQGLGCVTTHQHQKNTKAGAV